MNILSSAAGLNILLLIIVVIIFFFGGGYTNIKNVINFPPSCCAMCSRKTLVSMAIKKHLEVQQVTNNHIN